MRRLIRWHGAPWLAMGLAIGALLAPAAAVSAAGLVKIVGAGGTQANVTKANQLLAAPAGPNQMFATQRASVGNGCVQAVAAPAGKGLVLTDVVYNVWQNTTPGAGNWISLFRDATCTLLSPNTLFLVNPAGLGAIATPISSGFALKAGAKLYTRTSGNVIADVHIRGYTVPAGAVAATTPTSARPVAGRPSANLND